MRLLFHFLFIILLSQSAHALGAGKKTWMWGLGFGFSPNYLVSLSGNGVSSGTPYTTNYLMEYESSLSAQFDFRSLPQNSWGLMTGLHYEPGRKLQKITANGIQANAGSGTTSTFETEFIYIAGAYRWDSFFIPIGLTYGVTHFKPASGTTGISGNTQNGVGSIIGLGWYVDKDMTIEYVGRSASTSLNFNSDTNSDFETNSGMIATALLSVKCFF